MWSITQRSFLVLLLLFSYVANAQNRTVTGRVVSGKSGEPLSGATISLPSINRSVVADNTGAFSISVPANTTMLQVSFAGFTVREIPLTGTETSLTIRMDESANNLDEVVVIGYNTRRRGDITSAVQVIDEKKLKDVTANNIGTMLQGKVAGLQVVNSSGVPGAQPEIRLRGVSSINAAQSPLFVVDGIIGGNYDPNDVESVTVLKDAGATAIYGSQANGGVIIITTKKAKAGKLRYEARITSGFRTPDFGQMDMMNSRQLYNHHKEFYRDYVPTDTGNSYKIDLQKFFAERPTSLRDQDTDWQDVMFNRAFMQNYYASVAGRSDKSDYYLGISYYDEKGTFRNTGFKRLNLRANSTLRLGSRVSVTNNINLSGATGNGYDYNNIYYAYLNLPWDNPTDSTGGARYVDGNSQFRWWSRDKINPLHTIQNSNHPYKGFDANYDFGLNVSITDWLSFTNTSRVAAGYNKASNYFSPVAAGTYNKVGYIDENSALNYGVITNNLLKFNFRKGDHSINGLAGMAYEKSKNELQGGSGRGLPVGVVSLSAASQGVLSTSSATETSILSYLSQVNYSFKNRYFLSGSIRTDASSNFPSSNRRATFPSVSAAWAANNECFFRSRAIDNLRLRASYGVTGTQDIGALRYLGLYSLSTQYNNNPAATPLQLPSPNLTWESKHQVNVGFELGLFKRVSLTVDAYQNTTKNLLLQVSQPLSVGFETRWENAGQIENRGIELGLSTTNIRSKAFEWTTDFNINFNSNKLRNLPAAVIKTGAWAISQIYRNGGNLYEFYMPKWAGVNAQTGAPQWEKQTKDASGNVTKTELTSDYAQATAQEVGSALPKFQGGFNNTFRYKDLTLGVNTYFVSGNKVFSNNLRFVMNDGSEPYLNQAVLPDGYSIWTKPGDIATNPSMQNNAGSTQTSSRYLMDGSFLAIRNITLAYALPGTWMKRLRLDGITVSVSADNVYTFTNFFGQDPQTTITPGAFVTPGVSDFKYPNNRQFLFNINMRF